MKPPIRLGEDLLPTGTIIVWVDTSVPKGWLLCFGQAVSRSTYRRLFGAVGTAFGSGDGSTTFNLPDLRGRVPLGKDNLGGTSANRVTDSQADNVGQGSGAEAVTLATSQLPAHTHNLGNASQSQQAGSGLRTTDTTTTATSSTGGGGSHNNVQPYQTFTYAIKV
jgi:microcystin-dependent protein